MKTSFDVLVSPYEMGKAYKCTVKIRFSYAFVLRAIERPFDPTTTLFAQFQYRLLRTIGIAREFLFFQKDSNFIVNLNENIYTNS